MNSAEFLVVTINPPEQLAPLELAFPKKCRNVTVEVPIGTQDHILQTTSSKRYYQHVSGENPGFFIKVRKSKFSTPQIPTSGISIRRQRNFELKLNPKYLLINIGAKYG